MSQLKPIEKMNVDDLLAHAKAGGTEAFRAAAGELVRRTKNAAASGDQRAKAHARDETSAFCNAMDAYIAAQRAAGSERTSASARSLTTQERNQPMNVTIQDRMKWIVQECKRLQAEDKTITYDEAHRRALSSAAEKFGVLLAQTPKWENANVRQAFGLEKPAPAASSAPIHIVGAGGSSTINLALMPGRNTIEKLMNHLRAQPGGAQLTYEQLHEQACDVARSIGGGR